MRVNPREAGEAAAGPHQTTQLTPKIPKVQPSVFGVLPKFNLILENRRFLENEKSASL